MAALNDELTEQMAAFDRDRGYVTQALLKQGVAERTELVEDASGRRYVRKYLKAPRDRQAVYERLAHVTSPYIAGIADISYFGDTLVIVSEFIEGTTLRDYVEQVGALPPEECRSIFSCLAAALEALHGAPGATIVHRDINPANIIVKDGKAWLIDFGIARIVSSHAEHDTKLWGTAGYAAPEQFGFAQSDARTDVYALGMVLRFMATAAEPDDVAVVPRFCRNVVARATALDPARRYRSAQAMKSALGASGGKTHDALQTQRSLRIVWRIWQLGCALVAVFFVAVFVVDAVAHPTVFHVLFDVVLGVFWFALPAAILSNFADYANRIRWFRVHRFRKVACCFAVSISLGVVYSLIATALGGMPLS